jgi:hypothetical protein
MNELGEALDRMGSPRVLVLGDLILDRYAWGAAERVSPEAPVLVLRAEQDEVRLGGAASVARQQAGLGALDPRITMRQVIPAVVLMTLGFQTIFASFFLSIITLRRRG